MFIRDDIEETAANVEETAEAVTEPEQEVQPVSPTEQIDQTKAFATRLKEEKAKAKLEARQEIAQSFGYNTWDEYITSQTDSKLVDKGLDPDTVRPVLQELIKNDPEYIEAMKIKAERDELEKELFAKNSIDQLNATFGTSFKSVNDLDPDTVKLWNSGVPLEKAFAANNWSTIKDNAVKKATTIDNGKSHLKSVAGSSEQTKSVDLSAEQLAVFKTFGISEEAAREYVNRKK